MNKKNVAKYNLIEPILLVFPHGRIWLVGFHGISTFVGYSTPNPFYANNQSYFNEYTI